MRIVLLKSFDQDGFVFFTNYESTKGKQLEANPYAALGFYWIELDRQIRISGKVEKTSREESQTYFHSRPVGSQLSAWASRQSEVVDGRRVLDARMAEMTERFRRQANSIAAALGRLPAQAGQNRILAGPCQPFARPVSVTRGRRMDRGKSIGSRRRDRRWNADDNRRSDFALSIRFSSFSFAFSAIARIHEADTS